MKTKSAPSVSEMTVSEFRKMLAEFAANESNSPSDRSLALEVREAHLKDNQSAGLLYTREPLIAQIGITLLGNSIRA